MPVFRIRLQSGWKDKLSCEKVPWARCVCTGSTYETSALALIFSLESMNIRIGFHTAVSRRVVNFARQSEANFLGQSMRFWNLSFYLARQSGVVSY